MRLFNWYLASLANQNCIMQLELPLWADSVVFISASESTTKNSMGVLITAHIWT